MHTQYSNPVWASVTTLSCNANYVDQTHILEYYKNHKEKYTFD